MDGVAHGCWAAADNGRKYKHENAGVCRDVFAVPPKGDRRAVATPGPPRLESLPA